MSITYDFLNSSASLVIKTCSGQAHSTKKHFHDALSIAIVDKGQTSLSVNKKKIRIATKQLIIIPSLLFHECRPDDIFNWKCRIMYIGPKYESLFTSPDRNIRVFELTDNDYYGLSKRVEIIKKDMNNTGLESFFAGIVDIIDNSVIACTIEPSSESTMIKEVKKYIEQHYLENICLQDLEMISGINRYSMIKMFSGTYNVSPLAYQKCLRVEHAKASINRDSKLSDIALENSFYDQPHFTRLFKKIYGITPARYKLSGGRPSRAN